MMQMVSQRLEGQFLAPVGVHYILELYDCPFELLNDLEFVMRSLKEAVVKARATLLGEVSHQFHPQGVTALLLLSESHISIHTWPESGYAALDIFTCGDHAMPDRACTYLKEAFQSGRHAIFKLPRNKPAFTLPRFDTAEALAVAAR